MKRSAKCPILSVEQKGEKIYQSITAQEADWQDLNMEARTLDKGEQFSGKSNSFEMVVVLMGGNFTIETKEGSWSTVNGRKDVFSGLPHAVYIPINTEYTITADAELTDICTCWVPATKSFPIQYITPDDVEKLGIELRGGDNASRQINKILPPGSMCEKIVCVEVYTPSGNWSSFPAHKHDCRKVVDGKLIEADLEEIYFYKIDKPQGFALQKVYNDDRSLDEIAEAHNNDAVLVPEGYHPVVSAPGYNTYYLNFLAGSDQALAASDDPDHKWYYNQWKSMDQRLPIVTREMNK